MATKKTEKYYEAVGRRKTAVARVRLFPGAKKNAITINEKELSVYFPTAELLKVAGEAFPISEVAEAFTVTAKITGGGVHAQAEALRLGIARALVEFDTELRSKLKKAGFIKRDGRTKERRKFGLKKARKSPQWSKR